MIYDNGRNTIGQFTKGYGLKIKDGERKCTRCERWFPATNEYFSYKNKSKGQFSSWCKECAKKHYRDHFDENRAKRLEYGKRYLEMNADKIHKYNKLYREKNRSERAQKMRERRHTDPFFKLQEQARSAIISSFKRKGTKKNTKSAIITGMSSSELTEYLLKTYEQRYGKEWDGKEKVHIDHIIPLATAKTEEDIHALCHYSNLQLLAAQDNLQKGAKYNKKEI